MTTTSVRAVVRLDRVPVGSFHRRFALLVCLGMVCDSFDNTLSGTVLAAGLDSGFSTLELNSLFLTVTFGGLATGAAFAGWLSDRFGRSLAFQVNLALFGVLALCAAAAPNMQSLIALRAIMSVGMGAEYVMCYGLITEFIPRRRRGRYLALLGVFAGLGVTMSALFGWLIIPVLTWRAMFVIGGLAALITWWLRRDMPESPTWLESRGRHDEAEAVLRRIETQAGVTPAPPVEVTGTAAKTVDSHPEWVPITVLLSRPVIRRTLMALVVTLTCLFGSYSITGWMPTFFVEQGMTVSKSLGFNAAIMSGYVVGPLLSMLVADRLGQRGNLILFGSLAALFAAIYPFMTAPTAVIAVGFVLVAMVATFLVMALGTTPSYFPTEFRFRGGGFAQTVGRVGLIFSPTIILGLFHQFGIVGVILVVSGLYLLVTLLNLLVRVDTSPEALGELVDEAEGATRVEAGLGGVRTH